MKKEEEEERRKREEELRADEKKKLEARERKRAKALKWWELNRRVHAGSTLSSAEYAAWYYWDGGASSSSSASDLKKKRKKKRRKRRRRPTAWRACSSHPPSSWRSAPFIWQSLGCQSPWPCRLRSSLSSLCLVRQRIHYASVYALVSSLADFVEMVVFSAIWFDSGYMLVLVYEACFAGDSAPRAVFLRGFQALMRCIMAGMDHQEQFMAPSTKLRKFRSHSSSWSSSSLSFRRGRSPWSICPRDSLVAGHSDRLPCSAGRAASWVVVHTCRKLWLSTVAVLVSSFTCPLLCTTSFACAAVAVHRWSSTSRSWC